jgi:hypothetical protein
MKGEATVFETDDARASQMPLNALCSKEEDSPMLMRAAVANEAEIDRRIKEVARKLAPDVAWIRYALTLDSTGEESLYFRVVLSDQASREKRLRAVTRRVESELSNVIAFDEYGLNLYFNYRSRSEQAEMKEPAWRPARS